MSEQDDAQNRTYAAYMLRLWQSGSQNGLPLWRASLEDPATGERLAFSDLSTLFAFLRERTQPRSGRSKRTLSGPSSEDAGEEQHPTV